MSQTVGSRRYAARLAVPAALLVFSLLSVLLHLSVWASPLTHNPGGKGDPVQTMWFLNWVPFALTHHQHTLLSTYVNYPDGINLMWNTSMPALSLLLWPVTTIWGAIVSYNVIVTAGMALAAFFAFLAIRRYVGSDLAAAAGGMVLGFSPAVIAQQGHAQVVFSMVTIPLALLLSDELLVRQRLPVWLLGGLIAGLAIFQFFVFEEFFATEFIVATVLLLVLAAMHRDLVKRRFSYAARAVAVGGAFTVAALAYPFLAIQLGGPYQPGVSLHDPNVYSTDLLNPALPTGIQLLAPHAVTAISASFSGNGSEADGYLGIPLLLVFIVVAWRYWRVAAIRVAAVAAIIVTLFSLGPHLHVAGHATRIPLPWSIVSHLPLIRNILPSRLMFFVFLAAGLAFAYALQQLNRPKPRAFVSALLIAAVIAPLVPRSIPLPASALAIPRYFLASAVNEIPAGAAVYAIPLPSSRSEEPLYWQIAARMRFKLVGAGDAFVPMPAGQRELRKIALAFSTRAAPPVIGVPERRRFLSELQLSDVRVVIVGPSPHRAAAVAFCTGALGFPPHVIGVVDVWVLH